MNIKWRVLVASIFMFIAVAVLGGLYAYMTYFRVNYGPLNHILDLQSSPGEFMDIGNDINVSSPDDVKYIVNGNYLIDIHFGDQIISMNKECFKDDEYRSKLDQIGIKVLTHEDEETGKVKYKITYLGERIEQLSRVN